MSNKHKNPTISFRITDAEQKQIETRILPNGIMKKDYFVRSCIYNRICVAVAEETPLLYAKLALKANGLQDYVDAMNKFN